MSKQDNDRAKKPKQQRETGKHGEDSRSPFVPGLVEVEFASAADSGLSDHDFSKPTQRDKPAHCWSKELSQIVKRDRILTWEPSFPLTYPWSRESREEALKFFKASGRDRFVTFRFKGDPDVS